MAKILYVTESGAGLADGSTLSNAWSIASLNTSGNWGAGAGKVSAGDTVSLNGTLTSPITIQSSGSAGNLITLLFATGAKYYAATFTTGSTSGLINANGKSYFVIDGGTNGRMEATDNGQFLTYQNDWRGCYLENCSNATVQNLSFVNMYVRSYNDTHSYCAGTTIPNCGSNVTVNNCTATYAFALVIGYYQGTSGTNLSVTNSNASYCAEVLWFGDGNADSTWSGIIYTNNLYNHSDVWGDDSNIVHAEGIHLYGVNGNSSIGGISITNSQFGPYNSGDHTTSYIFLEGGITGSPLIANNVFLMSSSGLYPSNGAIYNKNAASTTKVYNNTFVSDGAGKGISSTNNNLTAYNNVVDNLATWFESSASTSDYNCIYNTALSTVTEGAHSITTNPNLNGTYGLTAGSPCIGTGVDLSTTFTTDKNGLTRTVPWDMGAYKFGGQAATQAIKRVCRYLRLWGPAN